MPRRGSNPVGTWTRIQPDWMGETCDDEALRRGPRLVDASAFTDIDLLGHKYIKSGTLLGRTFAERDAGTGYGPYDPGDDDWGLLAFDLIDIVRNPDCELVDYGKRFTVKVNYLPFVPSLAQLTLLQSGYACVTGQ